MRRKRSIIAVVCIIAFFLSGCAHKDSDDVWDITHKSNTTTKVYISDEAEVVTDEDKKVTAVTEANKVIVKKEDSNPTTVTEMPKTVTENSTTETRNIVEIRVPEESDVGIVDETELATSTTTGVINEETTENTTTPMETTIIPETTSSNSTVSSSISFPASSRLNTVIFILYLGIIVVFSYIG